MKAIVLAGGSGTRLRPITHTSAKQLLPIANKPVLFYGLEALRDAGITDAGVVVGATAPEIKAAVGDGSSFGLHVTYLHQPVPLGLAHAILIAREYLADDPFVLYLGDNFIVGGIAALTDSFRRTRPDAQILLTKVPNPRDFGVAVLDASGKVVGLEEKPRQPRSDMALVGVCMFSPAVHTAVRQIKPSARDELEITDALQWMIDQGLRVESTVVAGYWKDTGNVSDLLEANRTVLESIEPRLSGTVDAASEIVGRVVVEPGARVESSRIVGPAIVGPGSKVIGSYIGPYTSIAGDCRIEQSEIEYSIVMADAYIQGARRLEASLIGRAVQVTPAPAPRRASRLVLGDHSRVHISP